MSVTHLELLDQMGDYPTPFSKNDMGDDDDDDDEQDGDSDERDYCDDVDEDVIPKIRIGVCAMNKKTNSQPMQEILGRMSAFDFVDIFIFPDETILNVSVDEWPICDCFICFYSQGFPLEKAIEYAKLRKPFTLNDLEMQYALLDRPTMYSHLENAGIETPRHAILIRDGDGNPVNTKFIELDDSVQIGDVVFQKPFVEKPVNAEDHNVYIYFPSGAGGGSQRLFRKVGNRSSVYSAESSVRKKGSYIYEDFVVTDGTDVKVYAVGPEYAHAEARKSPSLDGKVERDSQGKEIRYPVILNPYEKELANKVCKLFKQTVCGCDLLRTQGKSYVCDVNGFSFVKTSKKYYDDAAQVLMSLIVQELAPQLYKSYNLDVPEDIPTVEALEGTMLELRCVVGVIRHGDRTPKQKMKMEVRHPRFIQLFKKYNGFDEQKLKLKRPTQLQEVLNIARDLLAEIKDGSPVFESPNKLHQLKSVLEMYGYFSGINRKIQFKYLGKPHDGSESESSECRQEDSESDERSSKKKESKSKETLGNEDKEASKKARKESRAKELKETKDKEPKNSETKEEKPKDESDIEHSLLLILKWGGELTAMGKEQALQLGRAFRSMYPTGQGQYSTLSGYGLLRLHSTYRHDLKIYASDEGRVQMTAAAFAKGFLALEGELTPILVHLVRSDKNTTEMLDTSDDAAKIMGKVKHKLHDILHSDEDFKEEDFSKLVPTKKHSVINAMKLVKNSKTMCEKLYNLVQDLTGQLKDLIAQKTYDPRDPFLYHDETLELMMHRWMKLEKDFKLKNGHFDISLIPDIYDCIKYDVQHNSKLNLCHCLELYKCAKALADIVIPQEYGITREEKLGIAQRVCTRLLRKIRGDLRHADNSDIHTRLNPNYSQSVETPHRHVRTRLYFTSESHVHTVLNAFQYGKLFDDIPDVQWRRAVDFLGEVPELNYMTQMVIMLYEDPKAEPQSEKRFHVELHFSPGAKTMDDPEFLTRSSPTRKHSEEEMTSSSDITIAATSTVAADSGDKGLNGASNANEDASIRDMSGGGFKSSSLYDAPVVLAATNFQQSAGSGHSGNSTFKPSTSVIDNPENQNYSVTKDDSHSVVGGDYGPFDDKPFDESVYAGNERPRCTIGIESFSDSALVTSSGDSVLSSGTSIEESSGEEKVSVQQWKSISESELETSKNLVTCSPCGKSTSKEGQWSKSDSDMVASGSIPCQEAESREFPSVACIVESDDRAGVLFTARRKAHSVSEVASLSEEIFSSTDTCPSVGDYFQSTDDLNIHKYSSEGIESFLFAVDETVEYDGEANENDEQQREDEENNVGDGDDDDDNDDADKGERKRGLHSEDEENEKPSSAKSDTTDVRQRQVSFEVGRQGKLNNCGQPLRIVQSSPSLKKGSPTRKLSFGSATSAIRAVRNLSYAIQSALVVRPLSFTKSTRDSRKPPIAEFYEEMTKVESLNPLRTLHNAIPLKEMDSFFDRVTEHKSDVLVTPVNTPSRKTVSKKLSTRSSSQPSHLIDKVATITCEENLEEEDLESEETAVLDRPR